MPIAIIAAMNEELECILRDMKHYEVRDIAGRTFYQGHYPGQDIIATICGVGKVEAALTVAMLKYEFGAGSIVMTGLAGSLNPELTIGSAVVADGYFYHDVDATPQFP